MTAAIVARAPRQSAIVAAVAAIHVGAFLAISGGMGLPPMSAPGETTLFALPEPQQPLRQAPPDIPQPGEFTPDTVDTPVLDLPATRDDLPAVVTVVASGIPRESGGSRPAVVDYRPPSLRMHGGRLAALVEGCYPSAARRFDEEGRALARIVVSADGRAASWSLAETTGFSRLDSAVECVVRRLQFEPGRQDGRAVVAEVQLPIVFRLD